MDNRSVIKIYNELWHSKLGQIYVKNFSFLLKTISFPNDTKNVSKNLQICSFCFGKIYRNRTEIVLVLIPVTVFQYFLFIYLFLTPRFAPLSLKIKSKITITHFFSHIIHLKPDFIFVLGIAIIFLFGRRHHFLFFKSFAP